MLHRTRSIAFAALLLAPALGAQEGGNSSFPLGLHLGIPQGEFAQNVNMAGGIGLELKVAMDMFDYQTAATIILMIFVLVLAVEQAGSFARKRVIEG